MGTKGGMTPTSGSLGFQSSTSTTTPNPQAMTAYQDVLNRATQTAATPYQAYGGQLVAGFTPDQASAFQGVRDAQGVANPYIQGATDLVNQSISLADPSRFNAQSLAQYYNPYQQQVINATMANIRENNASQQNQLTGDAILKGYMGGDRAGVARAELARQQNLTNNQTLANLQQQGYQNAIDQYNQQQQTAIGAAQSGVGSLGNLGTLAQNTTLQGLQALLGTGGQQQQLGQQQLDTAYNQWQQAQNFPYQQAQWLAGITGAIAPNLGGTTSSSGFGVQQQQQAAPSTLGQIAGAGLSALSFLPKLFKDGGRVGYDVGGLIPLNNKAPYSTNSWVPSIELRAAHTDYPTPPKVDLGEAPRQQQETGLGAIAKGIGSMSKEDVQGMKRGFGRIFNPSEPIQLAGASPVSEVGDYVAPIAEGLGGLYADGGRVPMFRGGSPDDIDDVDRYLPALAKGESGGEEDPYSAIGVPSRRGDRPYGKYQIMGENIPVWSKEAGLGALTPQQFLADRAAQEAVARHKFGQYLRETGSPQEAAAMWFGGPNYRSHPRARDALGTDVSKYVDTFNRNLGDGPALAYAGSDHPSSAGLGAIRNAVHTADSGATMSDAGISEPDATPQERTGLGSMWSPEVQQGLLAAGLGMLASRSPWAGVAIGEGGLRGMQAYKSAQDTAAETAHKQAEAARYAATLAETKRYHDLLTRVREDKAEQGRVGVIGEDEFGQKRYGYITGPKAGEPLGAGTTNPEGTAAASSPIDWEKTGEDFLVQLPKSMQRQVKAIAEGRSKLPTGMGANNPNAQRLYRSIAAYDPTFDAGNVDARMQLRKEFASTSGTKAGGQITAANTAIQHLGELSKAGEELDNYKLPWVNALKNWVGESAGENVAIKKFKNAAMRFAEEATKFYRGTGGTLTEIQQAEKLLDPNQSPEQLRAAIHTQAELMRGKIEALEGQWQSVMGEKQAVPVPQYDIIRGKTNEALDRIEKLAKLKGGEKLPVEAAPAAPVPKREAPKEGDVIKGHRFKGGDPSKPESWEKVP